MTTLIRERYELVETLGAGGEARVIKALDRQHGRFVALKIRPVRDGEARELLLTEARILLAIPPHPALPLVREDFFDGDDYVVAMDWVDGTDLATLSQDRGPPGLAPSSVLGYLSQAAEALTHLHSQSPPVIHGDVKPGNLILTRGGRVKLVDFGMSSAPGALRRRSGTPGFRAPELAVYGGPSRASDIYALAATAFALLTGSAPAGVLPSWEGIDPAQAEQFEAAIRLGMATDPARRPATPGELVERLRAGWAEALPTGVITFCLSDIEGSTTMWESDPAAMAQAQVRHDELIADCVSAQGGRLIESMGESDSTVSVFDSATGALEAAVAATRALAAERWPAGLEIRSRFGLHTGEAERRGTHYVGNAVNAAARLRGEADGGQIFLSSVAADLVGRHLPAGYSLVDLGPHRLNGMVASERIYALRGPGVAAPPAGTECPYRGLLAFEPEDRDFFFGREDAVAELVGRLAPGRLVAVVGASGSGKSSVLRAGVIAAVRAHEVPRIERACLLTPGRTPALDIDRGPAELVVVDQFEELFTLCDDPGRRVAFIDALLAAGSPVAIGVRADMYGRLAAHPALARAVASNQVLLGAMTEPELELAVTEPARLAGLRLEPGLAELAVRDVAGEPGALPLLSHALRTTWERRHGRTLTVAGYRESGGAAAAVAQTADALMASMPSEQRHLARNTFVRLAELGEDGAATRRRVPIEDLVPQGVSAATVESLLKRLADARLVTLGAGTAEVAHEVLLREWPTLRRWLEEDREGLRLHRQLGDAARTWETGGREASDLYRGARLTAAADWARVHRDVLNAGERAFIDASLAEADRERRAQLRANRRLRGLLAGAVALLLVAVLAGVVALIQRGHAQAQALTSDAERVGAQALTEQNVDLSLLLGVTAVKLQDRAETRSDLLAALQRNPDLIHFMRPFADLLAAVRVSPDGRLLAVADAAGVVRFVDLATWRRTGSEVNLGAPVASNAMSFSPDSRTLVVVTAEPRRSTLEAIDVASRRARKIQAWREQNPGLPLASSGVAYSPDGGSIAVSFGTQHQGYGTQTAPLLAVVDTVTGRIRWQRPYPIRSAQQQEPHVAFTPSGTLLTSAQYGDTILWKTRTGAIERRYPIGGLPAISTDGHQVALGRNSSFSDLPNNTAWVSVLDLRSGHHRTLAANLSAAWIDGIALTPDRRKIVADAFDGVHVWDVATGTIVESDAGQRGVSSVMAVDPEVRTVIVGSEDGSIAGFDVAGARRLGQAFGWEPPLLSCDGLTAGPCDAVSPHSDLLADTRSDGTVAIVNLHTLRPVEILRDHNGSDNAVAWLPDGRTVVHGGRNGHVTFWDSRTARPTRTFRFAGTVESLAVSRDGKLLAVQMQGGHNARVDVVQIGTGRVLQTHSLPGLNSGGVEFSGDGRDLVALEWRQPGSTVVAWSVRSGRRLWARHGLNPSAMDITADSRLLGLGTPDGKVLLLDLRTGHQTQPPLKATNGNIDHVAFSADGHSLAVSGDTVSIWDLRSRRRLGSPFGPYPGTIPGMVLEPNGRLLIVLLGNAEQWPTDAATWERFACGIVGRNLTKAEWANVLPTRGYRKVCDR
jgi:class 3 adenylate cyclase/WD40 repeat protein